MAGPYLNILNVCGIADLLVGFIPGPGLISAYMFRRNAAAIEKGEAIRMKLLTYQIPLGFLAIILGILYIIILKQKDYL